MKKALYVLFLLCLLMGCGKDMRPMVGAPWKQQLMFEGPPGGTPTFKKGWRDGCETAVAANSNHLQKFFYKFRQDGWMVQDPVYYSAWKTAYEYCQKYVFNYLDVEFIGGDW